jgi:hypothetical protein
LRGGFIIPASRKYDPYHQKQKTELSRHIPLHPQNRSNSLFLPIYQRHPKPHRLIYLSERPINR